MPQDQPQPIATWNAARDVWETPQASLLCGHSAVYSATLPASGSMRSGALYEHQTSAHPTAESESSSLLPTPTASDGCGGPCPPRPGHTVRLHDLLVYG